METTELYFVALMKNGGFCYITNGPFVYREDAERIVSLGIDSASCYLKIAKQKIEIEIED